MNISVLTLAAVFFVGFYFVTAAWAQDDQPFPHALGARFELNPPQTAPASAGFASGAPAALPASVEWMKPVREDGGIIRVESSRVLKWKVAADYAIQ